MRWLKKVLAPTGEKVELQGARTWMVRWESRYGKFHTQTQAEIQAFLTAEDAQHFATELRSAFKLLKHSGSGTEVTVVEQE